MVIPSALQPDSLVNKHNTSKGQDQSDETAYNDASSSSSTLNNSRPIDSEQHSTGLSQASHFQGQRSQGKSPQFPTEAMNRHASSHYMNVMKGLAEQNGDSDEYSNGNGKQDEVLRREAGRVYGSHPEEQERWVQEHYKRRNTPSGQQNGQTALPPSLAQQQDQQHIQEEDLKRESQPKESDKARRGSSASGEWIEPVHAFPFTRQNSSIEDAVKPAEGTMVLPAFYRSSTADQTALAHRLAVLGVNNYSGEHGVGEEGAGMDPVDQDREIARRRLDNARATEEQVEREAVEVKKERVDEKQKEIEESLKNDGAEALKRKIVPPALLKTATKDGSDPTALRPKQDRTDTDRTLQQLAEVNGQDFANKDDGEVEEMTDYDDEEAERMAEHETERRKSATRHEKLEALIEEFGEIAPLMKGDEPERFIVECRGALFRGILVVGNIHLTTHRITFHAVLPPPKMSLSGDESNDILHSGAATIRRQNPIFSAKTTRVWMELDNEMITTYPSADEEGRVKPLRSILLESVEQLYPLDPENAFEIRIRYTSPKGEKYLVFTVDTQESVLHWHRDLESALFQHGRARRYQRRLDERAKKMSARPDAPTMTGDPVYNEDDGGWEMMRIALPLDRVQFVGTDDYMDFARLISLDIDVMEGDNCANVSHHLNKLMPDNPTARDFEAAEARKKHEKHEKQSRSVFSKISDTFHHRSKSSQSDEHTLHDKFTQASQPSRIQEYGTGREVADGRATDGSKDGQLQANTGNRGETAMHSVAKTGQGAFRGPSADPEDLTSNASIIPAQPIQFGHAGHKELRTAVNIKFGVLNERAAFAEKLEEVINAAHKTKREYMDGIERPAPVFQIGQSDLLRLPEAEGGAGLPEKDLKGPPGPKHLHHRSRKDIVRDKDSHTTDHSSDSDYSDSESEDDEHAPHEGSAKKVLKAKLAKAVLGIPENEPVWMKRCYLNRTVPFRGHIILSDKYLCFWRKSAGPVRDIKYRFPVHDVKGAESIDSFRFKFRGMAVKISGRHDLHFDFFSPNARSHTMKRINQLVADHAKLHEENPELGQHEQEREDERERKAAVANTLEIGDLDDAGVRQDQVDDRVKTIDILNITPEAAMSMAVPDAALAHMPAIINDFGGRRKVRPRRFCMLTIGSRGDIQPYIALSLGLMQDGHQCVIVTHDEFKTWVEGYGIEHRQAGGDPAALMKLSVDHAMFSPGFFKESLGNFKTWLDDLLRDAWESCHDADVLIESPSTMAGIHIAEALKIPYMRAFTMPWTRTVKYPQAFMVPAVEMGPGFNYSSYVLFDNIIWKATAPQINPWRKEMLGLPATDMSKLGQTKVPFMYNFSSCVVPKPLDWHDDIAITGYWTLANSDTDWSPPEDLDEFIKKAERDEKPLVYIGFGSITVPDPDGMTRSIVKAVDMADVRAIIAKGWSSKGSDEKSDKPKPEYSSNCYPVDKVPHGWLFPKVKAALHHGGAGTVGASLTAGLPTLIKPWFGDQYFWASRVTHLGVGLKLSDLDPDDLAEALRTATRDTVMIERAAMLGEKIRQENGVHNAINYIYANLPRASKDRTQLKWQKA